MTNDEKLQLGQTGGSAKLFHRRKKKNQIISTLYINNSKYQIRLYQAVEKGIGDPLWGPRDVTYR